VTKEEKMTNLDLFKISIAALIIGVGFFTTLFMLQKLGIISSSWGV